MRQIKFHLTRRFTAGLQPLLPPYVVSRQCLADSTFVDDEPIKLFVVRVPETGVGGRGGLTPVKALPSGWGRSCASPAVGGIPALRSRRRFRRAGMRARDVMTTDVVTASPEQNVEECLSVMTEKRIRHLPITEGGRVVGMVSIGDLVKSIIADQEFMIKQLEKYISGS